MHEDRRERLPQTHSRARIAALVCFDDATIARFLWCLFDENDEQDRNHCDEKRWDAKEPMPITPRNHKRANYKSSENYGRSNVDFALSLMNAETENASEG